TCRGSPGSGDSGGSAGSGESGGSPGSGDSGGSPGSGDSGGSPGSGDTSGNTIETVTPSELTVYEKVGNSWIDLSQFGPVTVDENTKTVTAVSPFGPGIFVIGVQGIDTFTPPPPPGCNGAVSQDHVVAQAGCGAGGSGGGGAGGGIPLPGSGVVLDLIAGVIVSPS